MKSKRICEDCGSSKLRPIVTGGLACDICGWTPQINAIALITERGNTHGDWDKQAKLAQEFKSLVRRSFNATTPSGYLLDRQQEAVEMICVKLSRILTGNPDEPDHWNDIAGYAELGKSGHPK